MEAGQANKVAFVIQARMKSTRLPGKILLPLPPGNGKPLLAWITDELKRSVHNSEIIVATSLNNENDLLESFCKAQGIACFRGDEDNVLSRFTAIAKNAQYSCIVRLTADNPIVDVATLDATITSHLEDSNDYTRSEGLPVGMNFEVIAPAALNDIENHTITNADKEHVTLFIKNSGKYKLGVYKPENDNFKDFRLTVDYPSDYTMLASLASMSPADSSLKGLDLVKYTFDKFPWLFEANADNVQKKQFRDLEDEIAEAGKLLEKLDFPRAAGILNKQLSL